MASAPATQPKQVLVIDDDRLVRDFTTHAITYGSNHKVTAFDSGSAAWRFIQHHDDCIALIVADMQIPEIDGLQLLHQVKSASAHIPFVIISSDPSTEMKAFQLGADAFVCKPFDIGDLFRIVRRFIPISA